MARRKSYGPGHGPAKGPGNGNPRKPLNLTAEQEAARRATVAQANRDRAVARRPLTPEVRAELEEKARALAEAEGINFVRAWIRVKREYKGIPPNLPSPTRKDIEDLAADGSVDAVERIMQLLNDDSAPHDVQLRASVSLIKIGYGDFRPEGDKGGAEEIVIKGGLEESPDGD